MPKPKPKPKPPPVRGWRCPSFPATDQPKGHTVEWADGLKITRLAGYRGQIDLCIEWQGRHNILSLGKRTRRWENE